MKVYKMSVLVLAYVLLYGCSAHDLKRATYDALHDKQCMEREGYPNCDPGRPSYDDYEAARKKAQQEKAE